MGRLVGIVMMRDTNIANLEPVTLGKVEKSVVFVSVNSTKNILGSCLGFNLEFETSIFSCFPGKVDIINFIKSNVNWRLVKIHETAFQWEQNTSLSSVIA